VKLTTHLRLVPRSKNEWSYTSTPNTPSWRGAQLKHRDKFTFTFKPYTARTITSQFLIAHLFFFFLEEIDLAGFLEASVNRGGHGLSQDYSVNKSHSLWES
jgi:hypothetical protein